MDQLLVISAIMGALLIGMISPGPSFLVVARTAMVFSRAQAVAVSVGMGLASAFFGILALVGLHVLLEQVSWLYLVLKLAGGSYLLFLAWQIFKGAKVPLSVTAETLSGDVQTTRKRNQLLRACGVGFITQVSNPKTAIVFASVFATFLNKEPTMFLYLILVPLIFLAETGWYILVAIALSGHRLRTAYGAAKSWIDRLAGAVMGGLGIKLLGDSV